MTYDYGLWGLVGLHVAWLLGFALAFLRPGRRREWRSMGIFTGFVVALYIEMYGFPLTIYLLTSVLGVVQLPEPFAHLTSNLWATLVVGSWAAAPLGRGRDVLPRPSGETRTFELTLSGGMMGSDVWTINGRRYPDTPPLRLGKGDRVRVAINNMS